MDKYKTKMTISKWFSFINLGKLSGKSQKAIQSFDAYVKKLTFDRALKLFLFAINDETNSLRHLDNQLVNPKLRKAIGVDEISYSQLSRAIRALDSSVLMEIFSQLLLLVHQQTEGQKNKKIYLIDSTTFSFSQHFFVLIFHLNPSFQLSFLILTCITNNVIPIKKPYLDIFYFLTQYLVFEY